MLPVERIIGESGITAGADGLRLDMRLPWYRSLPLSTTLVEGVTIDGASVDLTGAWIEVADQRMSLAQAADAVDSFWFVLDSAYLILPSQHIDRGSTHSVELTLSICPPYIPGMKRVNKQTEILTVGAAA
jgi:hypothetical protein